MGAEETASICPFRIDKHFGLGARWGVPRRYAIRIEALLLSLEIKSPRFVKIKKNVCTLNYVERYLDNSKQHISPWNPKWARWLPHRSNNTWRPLLRSVKPLYSRPAEQKPCPSTNKLQVQVAIRMITIIASEILYKQHRQLVDEQKILLTGTSKSRKLSAKPHL